MRQPPHLRWIEQAEAKRVTEAFYELETVEAARKQSERPKRSGARRQALRRLFRRWPLDLPGEASD